MYLVVYFWSSAIISARQVAGIEQQTPFGLIFANFMCAMTAGSLMYGDLTHHKNSGGTSSLIVQVVPLIAALCLLITVATTNEWFRFWAFCIYECALGLYYPSMAFLKSRFVGDEQRGQMYVLMRLPLNIFVVFALGRITDGEPLHSLPFCALCTNLKAGDSGRNNRFLACAGFLVVSAMVVRKYVPR